MRDLVGKIWEFMMKALLATTAIIAGFASVALSESRGVGAHEHGQGILNIAIDGQQVFLEFEAPGADIVGFEYAAASAEDRAAVDAAIAALAKPLALFTPNEAAGCVVTSANVALVAEDEDHGLHDSDHHGHEEDHHSEDHHSEEHHADEEHGHGEHELHHSDGDHAEHASKEHHGEVDHHEHGDHHDKGGSSHTEFHAEYTLGCASPSAISELVFGYFDKFHNAEALAVQLISEQGAKSFAVERNDRRLSLSGAI